MDEIPRGKSVRSCTNIGLLNECLDGEGTSRESYVPYCSSDIKLLGSTERAIHCGVPGISDFSVQQSGLHTLE